MPERRNITAKVPNITLFRGWADSGNHVWSPFVIKLEARLRFAGVKYTTDSGSPMTAPKGKIPYIELRGQDVSSFLNAGGEIEGSEWTVRRGEDGSPIASLGDSTLIIKVLTTPGLLPDINANLSPQMKCHDMALRALLEDKLYFYHTRERWVDNYYTMRDHALWSIPYPVRLVVGILAYRKHTAMLHGQGTGRFSGQEVKRFKSEIWQAIDGLLRASKSSAKDHNEPFWALGGDGPTEADATLFGFVVSVLICTAGPESREIIRAFPTVIEYAQRIHDKYFPDYHKWEEARI